MLLQVQSENFESPLFSCRSVAPSRFIIGIITPAIIVGKLGLTQKQWKDFSIQRLNNYPKENL